MSLSEKDLNWLTLAIFAPVLILVGILGFVLPPSASLTSGATPYNLFHIAFGVVGLAIVATRSAPAARAFNIGFGAIDLYQAVASFAGLFPKEAFKWTTADDVLHIVVGAALVLIGLFGSRRASAHTT